MNKKIVKRSAAVILFLLFSASAVLFIAVKASKGRVEDISSRTLGVIKEKYGVDVAFTGMDVSFFPPGIFFEKITASASGNELAVMEKCQIYDLEKILFTDDKKLKMKCGKSRFHAGAALHYEMPPKNGGGENTEPAKVPEAAKAGKDAVSLHFESESEFLFNGSSLGFLTFLDISRSGGKVVLKETAQNGGTAEIIFAVHGKTAAVRLDGIDLAPYRELIKKRTSFDISSGKISAFSEIKTENGGFSAKNDITVKDTAFFHPLIDSKAFTLPLLRFEGEVYVNLKEKSFSTSGASLSLGGINAVLSASYAKNSKEFSIKTESAKLNKLETLIHDETFEGYLFGGSLELEAAYSKKDGEEPLFSVSGSLVEPKQLSDRLDYLKKTFDYVYTNGDGVKKTIVVGERNPRYTPISLVPEHLIWAVVVSEDAGFFVHPGVDFQELDAAVKDNIKKHKLRGGSTIPQQLAKNLFLSREKTLLRKFREVLLAIELDAALSKERILEIYFNIIEWAPGVFGISHAAEYYFGKQPYELTPLESAYLASVIPGPSKYHYQFLTRNVSENWYKSLYRILGIMNETGHLPTNDYFDALQQTLVFRETEEE